MNELERLMKEETALMLSCAENISRMSELTQGLIATAHPEVKASLGDSSSILSQVLQSIEDMSSSK